jgi:hypothetical protein
MNWLLLLIVGVVCLIVAYYVSAPPPLKTVLNIIGWICVAVGLILFVAGLFGVPLRVG